MQYIDIVSQNVIHDHQVKSRFLAKPIEVNGKKGYRSVQSVDTLSEADLTSIGVAKVEIVNTPEPELQPWQYVTEGPTSKANGVWANTWIIHDKPLNECKVELRAQRNYERALMLESPSLVLSISDGSRWKFDQSSLTVLRENLLLYSLNPAPESLPAVWRDEDNADHPCSIALLSEIAARYQAYKQELYTASWAMKAAIEDDSTNTHQRLFAIRWADYFTEENGIPALRCIGQEYHQPEQE
ncbi:DUF4376 domain-containing protein [uncultured Gilvimarinus sp.]|uniref:DUF4376 domain-containing protein n=1 Tax=uncultured Gilvimarinus sp. TaxID=1689143 RepID=UPI0030EEAA92|tara:strand:+ start:1134 stop:1859 length:726 start_codon:yes stop_codon:yes gene_type:complete